LVQKFKVGHYNRCMLKVLKMLITAHALVGGAAMLSACGQKGPLVLPSTPESTGRATLPQTLSPWRSQSGPGSPSAKSGVTTETPATMSVPPAGLTTSPLTIPEASVATPR
jgi:predicted small lipoprotein YifL